jgi:hypothetical protein
VSKRGKFILKLKSDKPCTTDGAWIYLSEDYSGLVRWQVCNSDSNRYNLAQPLKQQFEQARIDYLDWIKDYSLQRGTSLTWWMTQISGHNIMVTFSFLHFVYLRIVADLDLETNEEMVVVCEDEFLAQDIETLLTARGFDVAYSRRGNTKSLVLRLGTTIVKHVRDLGRLVRRAIFSKKSSKPCTISNKPTAILYSCMDDVSVSGEKFKDRYFVDLPDRLEGLGYRILFVPWLMNISLPYRKLYSKLQALDDEFLIPEHFLTLRDYWRAFFYPIRSSLNFNPPPYIKELSVQGLVKREKWEISAHTATIELSLFYPSFSRYLRTNPCNLFVNTFENMPSDRAGFLALKQHKPSAISVGFCHCIVSEEFIGLHSHGASNCLEIYPNKIVTNGPLMRQQLAKYGFPEKQLFSGPAIRQAYLWQQTSQRQERLNQLLVLLSIDSNISLELMHNLINLDVFLKQANIEVKIKAHPMSPLDKLLSQLGKALPSGFHIVTGEIFEHLYQSKYSICMMSASVVDSICAGVLPIIKNRELGYMSHYLDSVDLSSDRIKRDPASSIESQLTDLLSLSDIDMEKERTELRLRVMPLLQETTKESYEVYSNIRQND